MEGTSAAKVFAHQLQKFMEQKGYSVRAFGKLVDPDDPERGRRRVQRHLGGTILPSPASRDSYAAALDVSPTELPLPSDDDGADTATAFVAVTRDYRALGIRIERLGRTLGVAS